MRQHFLESRHKYTRRVVCECGKLFSGGSSSGYRYHRCFFLYCFVFVLDEKDQDLYQCCGSMTFGCRSGSADPCFCLMDLDPDPAIFVINLNVANKKQIRIRDKHLRSTTLLLTLKRPRTEINVLVPDSNPGSGFQNNCRPDPDQTPDAKLLFRIHNTAGGCCHVPDPDLDLRIKGAKNWRFMRISVSVPSSDPDPQHWLL